MTDPSLFAPALVARTDLSNNTKLASQIVALANDAFHRSRVHGPERWDQEDLRFPTMQDLLDTVGDDGMIAVMYDYAKREDGEYDAERVVALAIAVPWIGPFWLNDYDRVIADGQEWEIKSVCVDGGQSYLKKGLAARLLTFLEKSLADRARISVFANGDMTSGPVVSPHLTLWFVVIEYINGEYWRNKGCVEVTRWTAGPGTWGCLKDFEILVLKKEIDLSMILNPST